MIKSQERRVEQRNNGTTPGVDQVAWILETSSYNTEKGEPIGPKIIQPPKGKTHHIKPVELGVEPNGHPNPVSYTHLTLPTIYSV